MTQKHGLGSPLTEAAKARTANDSKVQTDLAELRQRVLVLDLRHQKLAQRCLFDLTRKAIKECLIKENKLTSVQAYGGANVQKDGPLSWSKVMEIALANLDKVCTECKLSEEAVKATQSRWTQDFNAAAHEFEDYELAEAVVNNRGTIDRKVLECMFQATDPGSRSATECLDDMKDGYQMVKPSR